MYRCLVITLGRDAPGVNAAIRATTRIASQTKNWKVSAARRGITGLLAGAVKELTEKEVRFILERGGSILGSTVVRIAPDEQETIKKIAAALREYDLVVATGGLGSFSILNQVYESNDLGLTTTMFIPASIENEFIQPVRKNGNPVINAEAIGADSAANAGVSTIDRLRDQSYLNQTVFLVQCVGGKSNYLPLTIGLGCGAHRIYLPDYPPISRDEMAQIRTLFGGRFQPNRLDAAEFVGWIRGMLFTLKKSYLVVIVPSELRMVETQAQKSRAGLPRYEDTIRSLDQASFSLFRLVEELNVHFSAHPEVQIRSVILDDLQRGGAPTVRDRLLGTIYGEAAVEEFLQIFNTQDTQRRGNLNLLSVRDPNSGTWTCHPRQEVVSLFHGSDAHPGGLPPVSFYRQNQGLLSGYRPLAEL
jgi:6-phosphofructokinase 1